MTSIIHFLAMGGYAVYVWSSYGIAAVVLGALAYLSWRRTKAHEAELQSLQDASPHRRRRRAAQMEEAT
ncbi:MAG TPA: heme exporter protein CcmD [Alphaproteobacteria bacterium]|nr:heme exporter protein CcmD [Alphaproteobacteria bacterium]